MNIYYIDILHTKQILLIVKKKKSMRNLIENVCFFNIKPIKLYAKLIIISLLNVKLQNHFKNNLYIIKYSIIRLFICM